MFTVVKTSKNAYFGQVENDSRRWKTFQKTKVKSPESNNDFRCIVLVIMGIIILALIEKINVLDVIDVVLMRLH